MTVQALHKFAETVELHQSDLSNGAMSYDATSEILVDTLTAGFLCQYLHMALADLSFSKLLCKEQPDETIVELCPSTMIVLSARLAYLAVILNSVLQVLLLARRDTVSQTTFRE